MTVAIPLHTIELLPGSCLRIPDVSWAQYEELWAEWESDRPGTRNVPRMNYCAGILELMSPLPQHERWQRLRVAVVETILKAQGRSWEPLGSTTFRNRTLGIGLEPDDCFYIQHYQAVIGKDRIDLEVDPPPDLVIEADLTSVTQREAYAAIGVPELWIYGSDQLTIYVLQEGRYVESVNSPTFPDMAIAEIVPQVIAEAQTLGYSQALLNFERSLNG